MTVIEELLKNPCYILAWNVLTLLVIDRDVQPLETISGKTHAREFSLDFVDLNPLAGRKLFDVSEDARIEAGRLSVNCDDRNSLTRPVIVAGLVREDSLCPTLKLCRCGNELENLLAHPRLLDAFDSDACQLLTEDGTNIALGLFLLDLGSLRNTRRAWLTGFLFGKLDFIGFWKW